MRTGSCDKSTVAERVVVPTGMRLGADSRLASRSRSILTLLGGGYVVQKRSVGLWRDERRSGGSGAAKRAVLLKEEKTGGTARIGNVR